MFGPHSTSNLPTWSTKTNVVRVYNGKTQLHYSVAQYGICGPGSSVGIATDYGMDDPGSNSGGDEIFRPSRPALGPTHSPVPGLSRG